MEDDFKRWFLSHGGRFDTNVDIDLDSDGFYLRVSNEKDLSPQTLVVSCPHSLTISWLSVVKDPFFSRLDPNSIEQQSLHQSVFTRFFLVNQFLLQKESLWWPYIRLLPQPASAGNFNTPLWYDLEDLPWIRGTNLEFGTKKLEESWRQEYDTAINFFALGDSKQTETWTWPLYKWAATIFASRSFPGSALANSDLVNDNQSRDRVRPSRDLKDLIDLDCPILIPGVDFLNHSPLARVTWIWGCSECSLISDDLNKQKSQIWNNYGQKSNEECQYHIVLGYGFSIFRNPADFCRLAVSPELKERIANIKNIPAAHESEKETAIGNLDGRLNESMPEVKRKINALYLDQEVGPKIQYRKEGTSNPGQSDPAHQDIQWIRLTSRCMKENVYNSQASCEFSPGFLLDMSIAFANKREITHSNFQLPSSVNFSSAQSSRNKLHVACAVTMILQRQQMAITKHDFDLPMWPRNERQFHAARYRRNQLQILNYGIDSLLSYLRELTELKKPVGGDVRTFRLEHILTDNSQEILTDFRAALNAGLGTRNAAKIRKNRWVECAFSLWLCGLWVHSHREGVSRLSDSTCRIPRWLNFLRRVYRFTTDFRPHERQFGMGGDRDASEDISLLCESFMTVVEAAVKKNPRTLYGDSAVTAARLAWCLNIIREEGIMCPNLDGKTGEDDDEYVLFLEDRAV